MLRVYRGPSDFLTTAMILAGGLQGNLLFPTPVKVSASGVAMLQSIPAFQ